MKKFFVTLLSLSLSLILVLFAGCNKATALAFNNAFNGGNAPDSQYTEKLTYTVTSGNYKDLERSTDIPKDIADFSTNGTLTVSFNIKTESDIPLQIINDTDIDLTGMIYYLSFALDLNSIYTVNGEGSGEVKEYIYSDVLFLTTGSSFAPIYSTVKQSYNVMYTENVDDKVVVNTEKIESNYTTLYRKNEYKITSIKGEEQSSKTYDYDFKSVIDNAQLLFALRNLSLEKEASYTIPTVSPAYGNATPLLITNKEENTQTLNVKIDGKDVNESISVKNLTFHVNDSKNTGTPQYVSIQKSASTNIPSKALMTEYAQPLICYGSYTDMGALIFKLNSVEFSN